MTHSAIEIRCCVLPNSVTTTVYVHSNMLTHSGMSMRRGPFIRGLVFEPLVVVPAETLSAHIHPFVRWVCTV